MTSPTRRCGAATTQGAWPRSSLDLGGGERVRPPDIPSALELRREAARLVLFAPIRDLDAKQVGLAVVTFSLARENRLIGQVRRSTLFASAAIAAGLTLLLSIIARVAIVRPLGKLVAAANAIGRGQSSSIDVHSKDEIGQLAAAFRSMSLAIESRERRITARNRDMRVVLDNVGQGFLTSTRERGSPRSARGSCMNGSGSQSRTRRSGSTWVGSISVCGDSRSTSCHSACPRKTGCSKRVPAIGSGTRAMRCSSVTIRGADLPTPTARVEFGCLVEAC
jgi:HAMP domain-containing protein